MTVEPLAKPVAPAPAAEPSPELIQKVRAALERGAVDLNLQPVVTLPQRRVTHYELTATLRDEDEVAIETDEYRPAARAGRLLSAVDALVLDRALRIARRLKARDRDIALFVGMATETIAGSAFVSDIARRLDAAADLSAHIILSFDEGMPRGFAGIEGEMLGSLAEKGFRFAVSHGERLAFDAPALHGVGVRYVRLPAAQLVDPAQAASAEIHPADLPGLLRRHGITLVAENVNSEAVVADLLDADVRAASGALFGGPRPVRPEVFAAPASAPVAASSRPSVPAKGGVRSIARRA
jgi:cyclic-di-GMP phosphodiesterase TipF (flagellum assembly factor)